MAKKPMGEQAKLVKGYTLDLEVIAWLETTAKEKRVSMSWLVNEILLKEKNNGSN